MPINSYRPQTLVEVNRKIQQHSITLTQYKMTYAAKCAATLSDPHGKESFAVHQADTSCGKLRQRPCQQYAYQKSVR